MPFIVTRICERCSAPFECERWRSKRFCTKYCGDHSSKNRRHGLTGTPVNYIWREMRKRCRNPKNKDYPSYGGRGIQVCERWNVFENFLSDMGPRPGPEYTVDRIDGNGNYEPGNCRWATRTEQNQNRRPWSEWTYREDAACTNNPRTSPHASPQGETR